MGIQGLTSFVLATTLLVAGVSTSQDKAYSTNDNERHQYNAERTLSLGWVLYDGYAPLDFWGPMQILIGASSSYNITLSIIAKSSGPISTLLRKEGKVNNRISASMLATHLPEEAPPLDLLMVPGGGGNRGSETDWVVDFVKSRHDVTDYVASVCTGSLLLAKATVLDNKIATTNKAAWSTVVAHGTNVSWVPNARWTRTSNGKLWTSSGVAAGMDMTYALLSWMYGSININKTMNNIELSPHTNPDWDPYAVVHNVPGADKTRPLKDLVGPVGFD
ncbi:class I glutamine amidotransferase-like protein [Dendryphion nanum]|uniref:Class I glutamine amidotransferase-like protein n=1 Tax=Dendryphion nanum TaxID=256645 RepID=A0A9P9ILR4_9PLEO|nr:class I glutamine amidotransferase-like protein [Dendryphion nanum]